MNRNLEDFTDLELAELQHAARKHADTQTQDKVLRLLKSRHEISIGKEAFETLRYISLREDYDSYELILQFSEGGVATKINRTDSSREVARKLMCLVQLIEKSVSNRAIP